MAFTRQDSIGEPESIIVPDQIEPTYAWRGWKVVSGQLCAIGHHRTPWPGYEPLEAKCISVDGNKVCNGPHPNKHCNCGIYAAKKQEYGYAYALLWQRRGFLDVYGTVAMWDRVIKHKKGYRAQTAYPKHLFVSEAVHGIESELVAAILRANYGCEVDVVPDWGDIRKLFHVATASETGIALSKSLR